MRTLKALLLLAGLAVAAPATFASDSQVELDARAAAAWVATALTASGYNADFSLESLKEVDRFLDDQAPNGEPKPDGLLSQQLGSRLFALGAYVGEVVLRRRPGEWAGDDQDPNAEINIAVVLEDGTRLWPIQRVMKRYKDGLEESIHAYGLALVDP